MSDIGRNELRVLVTGALFLVSTAAVLRAISAFIDNPMPAAVIGAAVVSLIASRAEVPAERFGPRARKRIGWGALVTLMVTACAAGVAVANGGTLEASGASGAAFFGIAEAVGIGYSREVLLRGIPLTFAKRAGIRDGHAFTFAAMAGVAAVLLEPNAKPMGLALTAASGAAFTALWLRSGDGYAPIAAHILWVWLTDAALTGDIVRLTPASGVLTAGPNASGAGAIAATVAFSVAAVAILTNRLPLGAIIAKDLPGPDEDPPPKKRASRRRKKKREAQRES